MASNNHRYLPKRNENKCPYKDVYINVHNIIPNNPKGKTAQVFVSWSMNTMEYYLATKGVKYRYIL